MGYINTITYIGLLVCVILVSADEERSLHGERIYLRAWSEQDATFITGTNEDYVNHRELLETTPDILPVSLHSESEGRLHGMLLRRNLRIDHPVEISIGGEIIKEPLLSKGEAMYQDSMSRAIIGVRHVNGQKQYDGSFHLEGVHYELHPLEMDDGIRARGFEEHYPHVVLRASELASCGHGDDDLDNDLDTELVEAINPDKRGPRPDVYDVEMALVVDYASYLKWFTDEKKDKKAAIKRIRYFFSYIYNGMQRIYSSIPSKEIGINVWFKHVSIQTSLAESAVQQHDSTFTPKNARSQTITKAPFMKFLTTWKNSNGYKVPQDYDHVMYFMPYRITKALGTSPISGVCGERGFSLFNDQGFESYRVMAHELGHNLGAWHDGHRNARKCTSKDHYVMATGKYGMDDPSVFKPFDFSPCSVSSFKSTLATKSCLDNVGSNDANLNPSTGVNPGATYDATWQCAWAYGQVVDSAKHCGTSTNLDTDECWKGLCCTGISRKTGKSFSIKKKSIRGADGTPCNGGTCQNEVCTP